jgi:hypothetical protein
MVPFFGPGCFTDARPYLKDFVSYVTIIHYRARENKHTRDRLGGSHDQTLNGGLEGLVCSGGPHGHESTPHQECGPVLVVCDAILFVSLYLV